MTRSQRIALRVQNRVSPIKTPRAPQQRPLELIDSIYRDIYCAPVLSCFAGCYDAMDDVDDLPLYQDINPSEQIVFVRGNKGLPCS